MDRAERWFYSYLPTNMAGGCFDSLLPVFIVLAIGGSVGDVALVSVAASLASVPSLIFWGKASDMMKWRKHFIVMGFLGRAVAYTAMGLSVGTKSLLFANILMGLLASASTPAMSILILESFRKEHWSEKIGLFNKIAGIGNLAGIALGSFWIALAPGLLGFAFSLRLLFLVNAVLALIGAWLAFLLVVEPVDKLSRETFHEHVLQIIRWAQDRARYLPERVHHFFTLRHFKELGGEDARTGGYLGWFLSSTFIYNIGAVGFFTIAPVFVIGELGLGGEVVFAMSFIQALASTALFRYLGGFSDRGDKVRMLAWAKAARVLIFGLYMMALPIAALGDWACLLYLGALHLAMGATWAVIADTQLPIAVGPEKDGGKGSRAGVFNASVGLGAIAGGALGGIAASILGLGNSMVLCSAMILVSAAVLGLKVRKRYATFSASLA